MGEPRAGVMCYENEKIYERAFFNKEQVDSLVYRDCHCPGISDCAASLRIKPAGALLDKVNRSNKGYVSKLGSIFDIKLEAIDNISMKFLADKDLNNKISRDKEDYRDLLTMLRDRDSIESEFSGQICLQ